jgi:hypothetical protein
MIRCTPLLLIVTAACLLIGSVDSALATESKLDYQRDVQPLLQKYCVKCHGGDDVQGAVNFVEIKTNDDVANAFAIWEDAVQHLQAATMPPLDETPPTDSERQQIITWYQQFMAAVEARPAVFRPRRLSVIEYRNTLQSVFGFALEVAIIEAEQTVAERSLVVKLLPTDPPGRSGFKNADTTGFYVRMKNRVYRKS